jgi:hypothetical protein
VASESLMLASRLRLAMAHDGWHPEFEPFRKKWKILIHGEKIPRNLKLSQATTISWYNLNLKSLYWSVDSRAPTACWALVCDYPMIIGPSISAVNEPFIM